MRMESRNLIRAAGFQEPRSDEVNLLAGDSFLAPWLVHCDGE